MVLYHRIVRWALPLCLALTAPAAGLENLSIEDAVRLARENNLRIQAARADLRAATGREKQASALANPEIVLTPSVSGPAGSDEEFFISQPLEINGSRRARTQIARGETGAARASERIIEREVVRDARIAYWNAALAQASVELHKDNVAMVESLSAATERQVEVGALPGSQTIKAAVELARVQQELTAAQSDLSQAVWALKTIIGFRKSDDIRLVDTAEYSPISINEAVLCRSALERRPEITEALANLSAAKGEVNLAKAARRPDIALQARRETFGGDGGLALGISVPLLDWGGARAGVVAANESVAAEDIRLQLVRDAVTLDVRMAVAKTLETEDLVRRYEQQILSQSERLVDLAEKGYQAGATGYLEVLEAQRTFREVRLAHIAALADHAKAKAELEWASATAIGSVMEERDETP